MGSRVGEQRVCELRSEAFGKIQEKNWGGGWWGVGLGGGGSGRGVEEGWGVRVDVNGEVKLL